MDSIIGNELRTRLKDCAPVEGKENTYSCRILFDQKFRGFEGHFEGNPVVPGVCLIQWIRVFAEEVLQKQLTLTEINQCRFRSPLLADMEGECTIQIKQEEMKYVIQADIRNEHGSACKMRLGLVEGEDR